MKKNLIPLLLCALLMGWTYTPVSAQPGPNYASPESRAIIEKMVEAHGGLEKWRSAAAISIEHILHIPNGPWMVKREVVEMGTRRMYSDWPLLRAHVTFDGQQTWSTQWPSRMLPPNSTLYTGFVPTNLIWLTQDDGAQLSAPRRSTFPGDPDGGDYHVIRLTYEGGDDYFELYIDPEGYRLRGFETIVTHGGMLDAMGLPPEVKAFGPMYHDFRFYAEVDGLIFPQQWVTRMVGDGEEIGQHLVMNHTLETSFDEARMRMPSDAVVDKTTKQRQMN